MLNKAVKELMLEQGMHASTLCVAMGQSESTFSRMFMRDESDPKASSIALLDRRLNIKVSDVYLKKESLEPELCRFFYSAQQDREQQGMGSETFVYIGGKWHKYTEQTSAQGSSYYADVEFLGEAPRFNIKVNGKVQCPNLYMRLCKEAQLATEKQSTK